MLQAVLNLPRISKDSDYHIWTHFSSSATIFHFFFTSGQKWNAICEMFNAFFWQFKWNPFSHFLNLPFILQISYNCRVIDTKFFSQFQCWLNRVIISDELQVIHIFVVYPQRQIHLTWICNPFTIYHFQLNHQHRFHMYLVCY